MTTNTRLSSLQPTENPDDGVDLLDLATRFAVEWRRFLLWTLIPFVLGTVLIYSMTPLYEASASLLPQGKDDSSNLASFFSGRSPGDIFIGLLESRSVADEVIDRADLLQVFKTQSREQARAKLAGNSVFTVGKDTLVTVKVRNKNADAAMRIANAYLEGLEDQREKMLQRESDLHNRFFEQQLVREADALAVAEQQLKEVQESSGVVQPEAQTTLGLNAIAGVRAQITTLQVQLAALLQGAAEGNSEVKALRAQIAQLQGQEHRLESAAAGSGAGAAASAGHMPALNLEFARKQRAVKYHEALFTSISNQYQTARLSEGYTGAPFVVVDRAIAPETKAWPPRKLLLAVLLLFSLLFATLAVGLRLLRRRLQGDPVQAQRWNQVRESLRSSR